MVRGYIRIALSALSNSNSFLFRDFARLLRRGMAWLLGLLELFGNQYPPFRWSASSFDIKISTTQVVFTGGNDYHGKLKYPPLFSVESNIA